MGPRVCTLSPFTIAQNSLHGCFGMSGNLAAVPPKAATIGPAEVIAAKNRIDIHAINRGRLVCLVAAVHHAARAARPRYAAHSRVHPADAAHGRVGERKRSPQTSSRAGTRVLRSAVSTSWSARVAATRGLLHPEGWRCGNAALLQSARL